MLPQSANNNCWQTSIFLNKVLSSKGKFEILEIFDYQNLLLGLLDISSLMSLPLGHVCCFRGYSKAMLLSSITIKAANSWINV